jgi:uncharacterized membrane protein
MSTCGGKTGESYARGPRVSPIRAPDPVIALSVASTEWQVGIGIGVVVVLVAAAIVIAIVLLARRIAAQAATAEQAVEVVRRQTEELNNIPRINDSGVRILHAARALRKAAVGK